mgnify:CR=1 FL=1
MRTYQKIISGGLVLAGLAGLLGCDKTKENYTQVPQPKVLVQVPTGWHEYHSLGATDFNGDGLPDIITSVDGNVFLYENDGKSSFRKRETPILKVPTGWHEAHALGAADFNGDGKPDIIHSIDGKVRLYLNKGNYKFELEMEK